METNSTREIASDLSGSNDQNVSKVVSLTPQLPEQESERRSLHDREQGSERPEIDEHESRELYALLSEEVGDGDEEQNRERVRVDEHPELSGAAHATHRAVEPHATEHEGPDKPDKYGH